MRSRHSLIRLSTVAEIRLESSDLHCDRAAGRIEKSVMTGFLPGRSVWPRCVKTPILASSIGTRWKDRELQGGHDRFGELSRNHARQHVDLGQVFLGALLERAGSPKTVGHRRSTLTMTLRCLWGWRGRFRRTYRETRTSP